MWQRGQPRPKPHGQPLLQSREMWPSLQEPNPDRLRSLGQLFSQLWSGHLPPSLPLSPTPVAGSETEDCDFCLDPPCPFPLLPSLPMVTPLPRQIRTSPGPRSCLPLSHPQHPFPSRSSSRPRGSSPPCLGSSQQGTAEGG